VWIGIETDTPDPLKEIARRDRQALPWLQAMATSFDPVVAEITQRPVLERARMVSCPTMVESAQRFGRAHACIP
jgi:hypothetical protein